MTGRSWVTGAMLAVLAIGAAVLVVLALQPKSVAPRGAAPLEIGVVAASGDAVWRWAGPADCNPTERVPPIQRSVDRTTWESMASPFVNVHALSFSDARHGVAIGTTARCVRAVAVTDDGGSSWTADEQNPVLLDAWYTGTTVWGVRQTVGSAKVAAYRVDAQLRLRPDAGVEPITPCAAGDGIPDQLAFWDEQQGLLLCQNVVTDTLLIARTVNAASSFEALADDGPASGLDGAAEVVDIDVAGAASAWVQLAPSGTCAEGQLRASDSSGAVFATLPCPSESADVDQVLDVTFTSARDGLLLGVRNGRQVLLVTDDAGTTWHR